MKQRLQGMVMGILMTVLMLGTVTAVAASTQRIEVTYGINVVVNGVRQNFASDMQPFSSSGRTFLPVRGIADALGLDVDWDANTSTVYLRSAGVAPTMLQPEVITEPNYNSLGAKKILGTWEIELNSFEIKQEIRREVPQNPHILYSGYSADEGDKLVVVNLTVRNMDTSLQTFLPFVSFNRDTRAMMTYRNDFEFRPISFRNDPESIQNAPMNPLSSRTGDIVFQVADSLAFSNELTFVITMGDEKIEFALR